MTTLLEKLRTLNKFFRKASIIDFQQAAETLGILVDAKVYILDTENKILGCSMPNDKSPRIPEKYDALFQSSGTLTDIIVADEICSKIPMYAGRTDIGTIIAVRPQSQPEKLTDDEIIILENAAHIISMQEYYRFQEKIKTRQMDSDKIRSTLDLLSYSEQRAVFGIFRELKEPEGILVTSKIADEAGLTRSVVVNAIRKLQSATIIQARSLGMKGTFIKVNNPAFFEEIKKMAEETSL